MGSLSRDRKQHTQTKQPAQQPSREKPKFTRRLQRAQRFLHNQHSSGAKSGLEVSPSPLRKKGREVFSADVEKGNFLQSQLIQRSKQAWNICVSQSHLCTKNNAAFCLGLGVLVISILSKSLCQKGLQILS